MSKARVAVQILLGLGWLTFGLNGFFHFFAPPPPEGQAVVFFTGLVAASYVFPVMSAFEIVAGVMLLTGRFVPLALLFLAPLLVNILGFHLMLDLKGIGIGAFFTVLVLFLAWAHRDAYKALLTPKLPIAS